PYRRALRTSSSKAGVATMPGSSPPLRSCRLASGSSASISQSRPSVRAMAKNAAPAAIGLSALRCGRGQQQRCPIGAQLVEALGERNAGVQEKELLLDRRLLEAGRAQ